MNIQAIVNCATETPAFGMLSQRPFDVASSIIEVAVSLFEVPQSGPPDTDLIRVVDDDVEAEFDPPLQLVSSRRLNGRITKRVVAPTSSWDWD